PVRAVPEPGGCCIQPASLPFPSRVSAPRPPTPAVRRPALSSVTRRPPSRVFARDRSINFWRLRTLFRSPAFDAVKIRCRSRRTSSSTGRQSTASQSSTASSGPFTTTPAGAAASNLPIGSDPYDLVSSQHHLTHVSALSGPGIIPYPASYPGTTSEGAGTHSPVS